MRDRRLRAGLVIVGLLSACAEQRQIAPAIPNARSPEVVPQATMTDRAEPPIQAVEVRAEQPESELSFGLQDGVVYVQHGREIHLVDPRSLAVLTTIGSVDRSPLACIMVEPAGRRLIVVSQSGLLGLSDSNGQLVAKSSKPIGATGCGVDSLRISWSMQDGSFLTNFSYDRRLPSTGVWLWRINGGQLDPIRLASGMLPHAALLAGTSSVWLEHDDGAVQIVTREGQVSHTFTCDPCVPSPDGRLVAVNQLEPHRQTRLIALATGSTLWESSNVSALVWSPSMRWLRGDDMHGSAIIDASNGRVVARWAHPAGAVQARWFDELLVETGGRDQVLGLFGQQQAGNFQVAFWRSGTARPRIESGVPREGRPEITTSHGGDSFLAANTIWTSNGKRVVGLQPLAPGAGSARAWSADDQYLEGTNERGLLCGTRVRDES